MIHDISRKVGINLGKSLNDSLTNLRKVPKIDDLPKNSIISNRNIIVKIIKNFATGSDKIKNFLSSKNFQVREGSQNLETVRKLYLVINYDGFPRRIT